MDAKSILLSPSFKKHIPPKQREILVKALKEQNSALASLKLSPGQSNSIDGTIN
jgi:hypothetical protein